MDPRVENGFQFPSAFIRAEDNGRNGSTVEAPILPQRSLPKPLHNLQEGFRAGFDNLPRDIVGIESRNTTRSQNTSSHGFPGTNATGDSPMDHVRKGTAAPWGGRSLIHLVRTR